VNSLTGRSLAFGLVTSFFRNGGFRVEQFLRFSRKRQDGSVPIVFRVEKKTLVNYNCVEIAPGF